MDSNYNYQVAVEPLHLSTGEETSLFATVRQDTRKALGVVSDRYGVVQNNDLIGMVDEGFKSMGLESSRRDVFVERGGSRLFARYDFRHQIAKVPTVGDVCGMRITARNSFDKSCPVVFELGMLRLVCTNGMVRSGVEYRLTKTHVGSGKLLKGVMEGISGTVSAFQAAVESFGDLANQGISNSQGARIIEHLTTIGTIPKKMEASMQLEWINPRRNEDKPRNLWSLYNAGTQVLTHEIEDTKFEVAHRVNRNLSDALFGLAKNPHQIGEIALAS